MPLTSQDLTDISTVVTDAVTASECRLRSEIRAAEGRTKGNIQKAVNRTAQAILTHMDAKFEQQAVTTEEGFLHTQELLGKHTHAKTI